MAKPIQRTAVAGMGALGLLFGQRIIDTLGPESVTYLMDSERLQRHSADVYTINGEQKTYNMADYAAVEPFDLVIVAVKSGALAETIEQIRPAVGPDTVIISVLNGITSEEKLAEQFDPSHIIDCVAIGMDAMRDGTGLVYSQMGRLQIGAMTEDQQESVDRLTEYFDRADLPYELMPFGQIRPAMWFKFMLNVGINQACTAYETDYGHATEGEICEEMIRAMKEVMAIADKKQISMPADGVERAIQIEKTLNPSSYPSMRQDAEAHRKTELDLFAGTVIALGKQTGVPTPVNEKYARMITQIESRYL